MTSSKDIKLIQLGHIGYGSFKEKEYKYISEQTFKELNCNEIHKDYILINRLLGEEMYVCKLPEIDGKKITSIDVCWVKPTADVYNIYYEKLLPLILIFVKRKCTYFRKLQAK